MTAPPLPALRVRQRLAAAIVAALHEPAARQALEGLAWDARAADAWLSSADADERDAVVARARRANAALASTPLRCPSRSLDDALEAAGVLFDAGLFFEAHEVLEPHWRMASGETREVLQGLIQIAVGYQHRANGNEPGARSLLHDGPMRVRGRCLRGVGLDAFAESVARTSERTSTAGSDSPAPPFPRGWGEKWPTIGPGSPG